MLVKLLEKLPWQMAEAVFFICEWKVTPVYIQRYRLQYKTSKALEESQNCCIFFQSGCNGSWAPFGVWSVAKEVFDDVGCLLPRQGVRKHRLFDTDVELNAGQASLQEECLSFAPSPEKSLYWFVVLEEVDAQISIIVKQAKQL